MNKGLTVNKKFMLLVFAAFFLLLAGYPVNSSDFDGYDSTSLSDEMPADRNTASEEGIEDSHNEDEDVSAAPLQVEEPSSHDDESVTLLE